MDAVRGLVRDGIVAVRDRQYDLERIVPVEREVFQLFIVPDADGGAVVVVDDLVVLVDHRGTDIIAVCAVEVKIASVDLL